MSGIAENILGVAGLRRKRAEAMANFAAPLRLRLVAPSGSNPGELRMLTYVPPGLPPGAPLVVVLHGCTQNAAAYDHGAGWSALAERHGFALLFPEQSRSNNANLCFNWFEPGDVSAGHGEVESIRQMTEQVIASCRTDRRRVFVTGLSAGGAMTAAMLATAPGLFAGGAVIAGLPYGSAGSVQQALGQMHRPAAVPARTLGDRVRRATGHAGPWPAVQIWHGAADRTVVPGNGEALVAQWGDVLGLPARPGSSEQVEGVRHDVWLDAAGRPALEHWVLPDFGHGTPVAVAGVDADQNLGIVGPHMLEAPISATWQLARSWGLLTQPARMVTAPRVAARAAPRFRVDPALVVEKALRAAGLRR